MDAHFEHPVIIGPQAITTVQQAGAYLIGDYPVQRRHRRSYRQAVSAVCGAITGRLEVETARAALVLAVADLPGKHSPVQIGSWAHSRRPV
jgi:hypothetical protein